MGDGPIRIDRNRLRIDLTMEVRGERPDGMLELEMVPDPRRYEWRDEDDGRVLFDRHTEFAYPESVLEEMFARMAGMPMYAPLQGHP